jgi:hypothetical protein
MTKILINPLNRETVATKGPICYSIDSKVKNSDEFEKKLRDIALFPCPDSTKPKTASINKEQQ